jgi:hypothetical protein
MRIRFARRAFPPPRFERGNSTRAFTDSMAYDPKKRNVREHATKALPVFDQKVYGFRYNAVLRPALS